MPMYGMLILVTELQSYNEHILLAIGDSLLDQSQERQHMLVVHLLWHGRHLAGVGWVS